MRWLASGKELLATGIEAGHGVRNYLIDVQNGNSKIITPEGVAGAFPSPDARSTAVIGPDGKWGIWPLDGSGLRLIPDWTRSTTSQTGRRRGDRCMPWRDARSATADVLKVNIETGKMEPWKTFGRGRREGVTSTGGPLLSSDGSAYAYVYSQVLSQAYVVKGLQ